MNFGFSDEQEQLRNSVAAFLKKETPTAFARAMSDTGAGITEDVWQSMARLGWLGLTVPEVYGGSGLGYLELAVVLEEMGSVVLPGPYFSTVALSSPAIIRYGTLADQARYCTKIALGELRTTLAWAEAQGSWDPAAVACRADAANGGFVLNGEKLFVPDASFADVVFTVAETSSGIGIFAVPSRAPGLQTIPMAAIDATRKIDRVRLTDVVLPADALLGGRVLEPADLRWLGDVAKTMLSAEMCGAAAAVLDLAVDYAKVREQFGRAIATFQAIQHKLADMKVALENSRSLTYYAAWTLDNDADDASLACAMAKAYASDASPKIVADGIQVHGGIGFTWEHDAHLYYKRVKSSELTFGDANQNRELVAELLGV